MYLLFAILFVLMLHLGVVWIAEGFEKDKCRRQEAEIEKANRELHDRRQMGCRREQAHPTLTDMTNL